jgi:diacylglycerol O-acyltransferase / wax synthase
MDAVRMSAQDALWLTMDRPNNLMVVDVAVVLEGIPTAEVLHGSFGSLVSRHPVFGRRAERRGTSWYWVDDPDLDLDRHLAIVTLGDDADLAEVQQYVAEQRAVPFDREHPLWSVTVVAPVHLPDGVVGSVILSRFHHAIADGVRLTQVMLGILDESSDAGVPMVARSGTSGGSLLSGLDVRKATSETLRVSLTASKAMASKAGELAGSAAGAVLGAADTAGRVVADPYATVTSASSSVLAGVDFVRHPDRLVDAFETLGLRDHRSLNDATSVSKLVIGGSTPTVWTGRPGSRKAVSWSDPIALDAVKAVARAQGVTLNDVLIAALAGALRSYLAGRGDGIDDVVWMVPVNLRPFDDSLPEDLGNYFALVILHMPLHDVTPAERIGELHHRMLRIKNSDEPVITFGLQRAISMSPRTIATFMTNFFANKAVGVLTNVPGPTSRMALAGIPVRQVIGFAPCSGDQPMTATIFTYDGTVTVGFATDAGLVPDPQLLVQLVEEELDLMCGTLGS